MSYYLYLIETKKEYTIHVINELTPLMYEGIQSIYEDAKENSNNNEELKLFQSLLRKIPSWNEHLIEQETNRIIKSSSKSDIIEDLINAVIKSNIMILTNTSPEDKDKLQIKHDITTKKFIHNSYIEIARNIFQNPFLFYHKLNSFELKKNQRECHECIKKSIEQAIRKLLPMNVILQNYLGKTFEQKVTDDFENPIIESDYNNLKQMLNKNSDVFQLIKQPKNNDKINITLDLPQTNKIDNTTENFKTFKELGNPKISPINKITTKISEEVDISSSVSINKLYSDTLEDIPSYKTREVVEKEVVEKEVVETEVVEKEVVEKEVVETEVVEKEVVETEVVEKDVDYNKTLYIKMKQSFNKNIDSEDASISYYRQNSTKKDYIEVYEDDIKLKTKNKQFLNYDKIDDDSSVNLKSIIGNISTTNNIINNNNKKKYFSKNNNL